MEKATINKLMALQPQLDRQAEIAEDIMKADPKISPITAMIIANDKLSADRAWKRLIKGAPYKQAVIWVGSYARMEFAMRALDKGLASEDAILDDLPDLWRGSDPDDTNPRFLELWRKAWERNGRKTVCDGKKLPSRKVLEIYRGQDEGAQFGCAWTLDKEVAERFAHGAATRQWDRKGIVYHGNILRSRVYGYLTGREESEIVCDPKDVV